MEEFAIAIALWDGVEELDFAGPYEVTAWSRMSERPISVRTVGPVDPRRAVLARSQGRSERELG
jgi:hypothetical protein